jgi:hypothetical protein
MGKRKIYNTTLDFELTKGIRILSAKLGKRQNDLIEEAIKDLLKKLKTKDLILRNLAKADQYGRNYFTNPGKRKKT